jgi:hypothetical protein
MHGATAYGLWALVIINSAIYSVTAHDNAH